MGATQEKNRLHCLIFFRKIFCSSSMNHILQFHSFAECTQEICLEKMYLSNSDSAFRQREKIDHSVLRRLSSISQIQSLFLQLRVIMNFAYQKIQWSRLFAQQD